MSRVYSDLEEGEIIDDLPPLAPSPKIKKLPRRYTIKENKEKHKKSCKHSFYHQSQKLAKLKKIPIKRKNVHKPNEILHGCDRSYVSSKQSKLVALKSFDRMKHYSPHLSKRKSHNLDNMKFKSILDLSRIKLSPKTDVVREIESCAFSEISALYKEVQSQSAKTLSCSVDVTPPEQTKQYFTIELGAQSEAAKSLDCEMIKNNRVAEKDESEDEEELRRIALSTCVTTIPPEKTVKYNQLNNCFTSPHPNDNVLRVPNRDLTLAEVVDMELDDPKTPETDDLFIIDTKPSSDIQNNSDSNADKQSFVSDDDFEVDMLRAELIENMYRKNSDEIKNKISTNMQQVSDEIKNNVNEKGISQTCFKSNKFSSRKPKKREDNSFNQDKANKSQKRLIISLNDESSTEESDDNVDSSTKVFDENPVASIEALISDIRQKSDCNSKANDELKDVPKAVSCLSKAQQEEYNGLMKILAKKKQEPSMLQEGESREKANHSPVNDLKILEGKLLGVSELLKKKREEMSCLLQEVAHQKQIYMKSKLTAQLLKEQYVAAEKVRRLKLQAWSKCCKKYEVLKKTVFELESKTGRLKNLCSTVGSCINGSNYSLPAGSIAS